MSELQRADPDDHRLRRHAIFAVAITLPVLAVVSLLMPMPFEGRIAVALGDLAHAPLFGGLTLGVFALLHWFRPQSPGMPLLIRSVALVAASICSGIAMELLQSRFGRSATLHDAVANGLGILAATCVFWYWQLRRESPQRRWPGRTLLAAGVLFLGIAWWTPLTMLGDVVSIYRDFPMLASFETSTELQRWHFRQCKPALTRQDVTHGSSALALTMQPREYPAATLIEMQSDWSAMKTFELDVTLDESYPVSSAEFLIKVIDRRNPRDGSDTFRGQWTLLPGQSRHLIVTRQQLIDGPATRMLELENICYVDVILLKPVVAATLRIDAIRLTLR